MEFEKQLLPAILAIILLMPLAQGDVKHLLSNEHSGSDELDKETATIRQSADIEHEQKMNDGQFYPVSGLPLPPGYAIPTGNNVPPPPVAPPNFPLPIYPPYFGFGGPQGGPGIPEGGQPFPGGPNIPNPEPVNGQYTGFPAASQGSPFPGGSQGPPFQPGPQYGSFANGPQGFPFPVGPQNGPFPVGPQNGPFPVGPQVGPFSAGPPVGPFSAGPQGGPFSVGPQGGPFPGVPQGGPFPPGPQGIPFSAGPQGQPFPSQPQIAPPPDYLTTQGLPLAGAQAPFSQPSGFNIPPGFAGPGVDFTNPYQQPFADETPQPEPTESTPTNEPTKEKPGDTVYASNGGYVYQRAK